MSVPAGTRPIRVIVVDDHAVVRSGLATFLLAYDDMELLGEAADGAEAVRLCDRLHPDVVLMDLMMPKMDGIAATAAIHAQDPHVQVVALTSFQADETVQAVLRAGAIGYLLKSSSADDLVEAIRTAHSGQPALGPEAARSLIYSITHPHPLGYDLTTREREVLKLMTLGLNNNQIAERLVLSRSTVRFHVSSILSKLGASGRVEAVALALQHHLVS